MDAIQLAGLPEHLIPISPLGAGAYGEVFLCTNKKSSEKCAVKRIRNFTRDDIFGRRVLREIRLLAHLRHENLLRLLDLPPVPDPDFDDVYLVTQYMESDLHRVIHSKTELKEAHIQAMVCQIVRGLKYLHSTGVCHRDLKPANILVNTNCTLKIADFGLARGGTDNGDMTDYVVTRWYRAPEVMLLPSEYNEELDLWSLGCIQCELYGRKPLFPGKDHVDMLLRIGDVLGFNPDTGLDWLPEESGGRNLLEQLQLPLEGIDLAEMYPNASPQGLDLALSLLTWDPSQRSTAAQAIAHPYLAHLRDERAEQPAPKRFDWDFDCFEANARELKDKVYAECARIHPEIVKRDAEWLARRGFLPAGAAAHYDLASSSPKREVKQPSKVLVQEPKKVFAI